MAGAISSPASFLQSQNALPDLPPTFVSQASSVHPRVCTLSRIML